MGSRNSSNGLPDILKMNGFDVTELKHKQGDRFRRSRQEADLLLLDAGDQVQQSIELCKNNLKDAGVPLILLMGRHDEDFHVQALAHGADDVVTAAIRPVLLLAKIESLLRRCGSLWRKGSDILRIGELMIDLPKRSVLVKNREAPLTTLEFEIFSFLVKNAGRVVSRDDVHQALYNSEHNGYERSIDLYISRIRQKIGDDPVQPRYLKTVRGVGYLFVGIVKHAK